MVGECRVPSDASHFFDSLSVPCTLGMLFATVFSITATVALGGFLLLNGEAPPNLLPIVATGAFVAVVPLFFCFRSTLRHMRASRDSLKAVCDDLTKRVADLDEAAEALEEAHEALELQIARRNRELDAAIGAAEQANRVKSAFLAHASHEFRTPLNAIIGFSEMILEPRFLSPENRLNNIEEYAGIIQHSGKHLMSVVGDMMALSMAGPGQTYLQIGRVDLPSLVKDIEKMVAEQAQVREQTLICLVDPGAGALEADRRALVRIVLNLLNNAIRYSPPGKTILFSVTRAADHVAFTVRDEGPGMSEEAMRGAVEPFTRLGDTDETREVGPGLGLCIVSALAKAHGGTLALTSEPDKGTEARVILPCRVPAAPAVRVTKRQERAEVA